MCQLCTTEQIGRCDNGTIAEVGSPILFIAVFSRAFPTFGHYGFRPGRSELNEIIRRYSSGSIDEAPGISVSRRGEELGLFSRALLCPIRKE